MDRFGPTLIVAIITLLVLVAMWWGWRRRSRRDAPLRVNHTVPGSLGDERLAFDAFYVATTTHDRPLERLAVAGLGFRARARLSVHDAGLTLAIPGELPVFIPASEILSADRATATIDRVVERGGLVRLAWALPASAGPTPTGHAGTTGTPVDTYLRPIAPEAATAFLESVAAIAPAAAVTVHPQRKRGAA